MSASNYYHGFAPGGTQYGDSTGYTHSAHASAAYGTMATPYPPPPPPPPPQGQPPPPGQPTGYEAYQQVPGTVSYPTVAVSSDYGYGSAYDAQGYTYNYQNYYQGARGANGGYQVGAGVEIAANVEKTTSSAATPAVTTQVIATESASGGSSGETSSQKNGSGWMSGFFRKAGGNDSTSSRSTSRGATKSSRGYSGGKSKGGFGYAGAPKNQQLHYCDVCRISCAGPQTYKEHLEGQKHKKKEIAAKQGAAAAVPKGGQALHCQLCDVTCTGSDAYAAHIRGSKHQKVVKLHQKLGKPIPSNEPTIVSGSDSGPAKKVAPLKKPLPKVNFVGGTTLRTTPAPIGPQKPTTTTSGSPWPAASHTSSFASKSSGSVATPVAQVSPEGGKNKLQVTEVLTGEKFDIPKLPDEKDVQPVGNEYVEEVRGSDNKLVTFHCKLCDCKFLDPNAKEMHLKGRRHRLAYKRKVDPSLQVDEKPSTSRTSERFRIKQETRRGGYGVGVGMGERPKKAPLLGDRPEVPFPSRRQMDDGDRRYWDEGWGGYGTGGQSYQPGRFGPSQSQAASLPPSLMSLSLPSVPAPPFFGVGPSSRMQSDTARLPETLNDRFVKAKHAEIFPKEDELGYIHKLVANVEKALKMVSDALTDATVPKDEKTEKPKDERILKGVMRVGALAKSLLITGENTVQLVVLCMEKPTRSLLTKVLENLPKQLAVVHGGTELYNLQPKFDDAAIHVSTFKEPKLTVQVTFTSFLMRPENWVGADSKIEDPVDVLNKTKCLEGLAWLRHAKWYTCKANTVQNCTMVVRILRDYCIREPSWKALMSWPLELLVQKVLESFIEPMTPGDALMRVFEAVADGLLLPGGPGLIDPCEKEICDAAAYLTNQQRENITASAQTALRYMNFRGIYKLLDMDPILPPEKPWVNPSVKKRRLETSEDGKNESKLGTTGEPTAESAADKKIKVEEGEKNAE